MKALLFLPALFLSCHAFASAAAPSMPVGEVSNSSLAAAFLGAMTIAAGLMRIRRRR